MHPPQESTLPRAEKSAIFALAALGLPISSSISRRETSCRPMTTSLPIFRDDPYATETAAAVIAVNERRGIILDRTVFYAQGGGQPGDCGVLLRPDGAEIEIATTVYDKDRETIVHVPAENAALPSQGDLVTAKI